MAFGGGRGANRNKTPQRALRLSLYGYGTAIASAYLHDAAVEPSNFQGKRDVGWVCFNISVMGIDVYKKRAFLSVFKISFKHSHLQSSLAEHPDPNFQQLSQGRKIRTMLGCILLILRLIRIEKRHEERRAREVLVSVSA